MYNYYNPIKWKYKKKKPKHKHAKSIRMQTHKIHTIANTQDPHQSTDTHKILANKQRQAQTSGKIYVCIMTGAKWRPGAKGEVMISRETLWKQERSEMRTERWVIKMDGKGDTLTHLHNSIVAFCRFPRMFMYSRYFSITRGHFQTKKEERQEG